MSVWMIGTGNITIKPEVDETLIKEYIQFSKSCFPEEYGDENFANTWFFDEVNKLFSISGKIVKKVKKSISNGKGECFSFVF